MSRKVYDFVMQLCVAACGTFHFAQKPFLRRVNGNQRTWDGMTKRRSECSVNPAETLQRASRSKKQKPTI